MFTFYMISERPHSGCGLQLICLVNLLFHCILFKNCSVTLRNNTLSEQIVVNEVKQDHQTSLTLEFFLSYQQHKVYISANYFFLCISFVECIIVTQFRGKCYLIF